VHAAEQSLTGVGFRAESLVPATSAAGGVAAVATAVPFVASLTPSERAKAAGAPVEADVSKLKSGDMMTVEWRGKPVWILRRTPEMLATLDKTEKRSATPTRDEAAAARVRQPSTARSSRNTWS
jgi:ubiquinol-cytochrome c reductase iron-sulfur subunit